MKIHYKILNQIKYIKYQLTNKFTNHKITPQLNFLILLINIKIIIKKIYIQ